MAMTFFTMDLGDKTIFDRRRVRFLLFIQQMQTNNESLTHVCTPSLNVKISINSCTSQLPPNDWLYSYS